jgi:16S rRNA G966 N2-methylase RsmD
MSPAWTPAVRYTDTPSLEDEWGVPPFSILDTRQGYWQTKRRQWISLGIRSDIGRADNLAFNIDMDRIAVEGREAGMFEGGSEKALAAAGTSIFDPVLAEVMYRWFCPPGGTILDPFAGGSVRGIVASRLGHPYIGIDLSAAQVEANEQQARDIVAPGDPVPRWIVGNSLDVEEHLFRASTTRVDMVFSCPPYYDLERYSDHPEDLSNLATYAAFRDTFATIIARCVARLRPDGFVAMVVGEVRDDAGFYVGLVPDTVRAMEAAGARFYNDLVLMNTIGTGAMRANQQMLASRKVVRTHQNVVVGRRGVGTTRGWDHHREAAPDPQTSLWTDEVA